MRIRAFALTERHAGDTLSVAVVWRWIQEVPPCWDADKTRIVGSAPAGVFDPRLVSVQRSTPILGGDWWRVEDAAGRPVGYGWIDVVWGDAEILLATAPDQRGQGIGTFILDRLSEEAQKRGLNYLYNRVRETHPEGDELRQWLRARGFRGDSDGRFQRSVPAALAARV